MIIYTQPNCGRCTVLKKVLDDKGKDYEQVTNQNLVIEIAKRIGTVELPIFNLDGVFYSGSEAVLKAREL